MKIQKKKRMNAITLVAMLLVSVLSLMGIALALSGPSVPFSNPSPSSIGGAQIIGASMNPQFNDPNFFGGAGFTSPGIYWSEFNRDDCYDRQDFIMQIAPGGCSPSVVRSDLLEEQNVPVFCKVMSIQANPLIDVSRIRALRFNTKNLPDGVSSISYFPAKAALRSYRNLVSTPVNDNLGYVVIVLSKQVAEKDMPEFVEGEITATIDYDAQGAFGIGRTSFYLPEMTDEDWAREYRSYGFWNGKGYVRADMIDENSATIGLYRDEHERVSTVTLRRGETSNDLYVSGFYCAAGLNVKLESITAPVEAALLRINGQEIWVADRDRILDNKCSIKDLEAYGSGGKVRMSCQVKNGNFILTLNPGKVNLSSTIDGKVVSHEYAVGEKLRGNDSKDVWVGYIGRDKENSDFVVLVRESVSFDEVRFAEKKVYGAVKEIITRNGEKDNISSMAELIEKKIQSKYRTSEKGVVEVKILIVDKNNIESEEFNGIRLQESIVVKNKVWEDNLTGDEIIAYDYYKNATSYYTDLYDFYPKEENPVSDDPYAAYGLYVAAGLAKGFDMFEDANNFYTKLINDYPETDVSTKAIREKELLTEYDSTNSRALIYLNNKEYFIELLDFRVPDKSDLSVRLRIDQVEEDLGLGEIYTIDDEEMIITKTDSKGKEVPDSIKIKKTFQVTEINTDYVKIKYTKSGGGVSDKTSTQRVDLRAEKDFDGTLIRVINLNVEKNAKLTLIPKIRGPRTNSSFKFKIGIEKRGIKLSDDRTEEMIKDLDEQIEKWSSVNDKLDTVVKAMKGACFATSAIFMLKNLASGMAGESMARNEVMTRSGGWNDKCEGLVSSGKFATVQTCLLEKNSEIEKDVKIYSEQITEVNKELKRIQTKVGVESSDILDFQGQTDALEVEGQFNSSYYDKCIGWSDSVNLSDGETNLKFGNSEVCNMGSFEQKRDILRDKMVLDSIEAQGGSDVLKGMVRQDMSTSMSSAKDYYDFEQTRLALDKQASKYNLGIRTINPAGDNFAYGDVKTVTNTDLGKNEAYKAIGVGKHVVRVSIPHTQQFGTETFRAQSSITTSQILVPVTYDKLSGVYDVDLTGKAHFVDGRELTGTEFKGAGGVIGSTNNEDDTNSEGKLSQASGSVVEYMNLAKINRIKNSDAKAYQNPFARTDQLMVKYFEREPYKGLPSFVPFDTREGWYVQLTYVLTGFGRPYDDSGRPVNYYICNVGGNSIAEFKRGGDDICRYYNGNTASLDFPGLAPGASRQLVVRAQRALQEAGRQHGQKKVRIGDETFNAGIDFGGEEGRCTDFMSAKDCNILFNVCDPVICPTSRCDLGGAYRVDNVIQSGIIGSLMLCLPNAKEGIAIPICLSGVKAGIEGYLSILESTRGCLNESLETGKTIGICDEIKSVYLCQFFWKQAAPFANAAIPRLLESFSKQGVRGGGEYLTVQSAWDNTQDSISYFRDTYAVNSRDAFRYRTTDEIGDDVCKSFMSVNYPNSKNFFDDLIEPDSPVQYHAWFSENSLTTATIPATSHYKVYYHIYAGNDQGAYYIVYLKDLPQSNYVHSTGRYVVDRGYAKKGETIDKADDFTTVSGYKQLCLSVNGQDKCGFGKVSTSFAVNAISDKYAEDQLNNEQIIREEECVAGTPSMWSLANPNLQAGLEDTINPELYNSGIIRVCATQNPGKQVRLDGQYDTTNSTYDKWKDVGYCGDKTIRCWLDEDSVRDVIHNKDIANAAIDEINLKMIGIDDYLTPNESQNLASKGEKFVNAVRGSSKAGLGTLGIADMIKDLTKLVNAAYNNNLRARGLFILGNLHEALAQKYLPPRVVTDKIPVNNLVENKIVQAKVSLTTVQNEIAEFTDANGNPVGITQEELDILKEREGVLVEEIETLKAEDDLGNDDPIITPPDPVVEPGPVAGVIVLGNDNVVWVMQENNEWVSNEGEVVSSLSKDYFSELKEEHLKTDKPIEVEAKTYMFMTKWIPEGPGPLDGKTYLQGLQELAKMTEDSENEIKVARVLVTRPTGGSFAIYAALTHALLTDDVLARGITASSEASEFSEEKLAKEEFEAEIKRIDAEIKLKESKILEINSGEGEYASRPYSHKQSAIYFLEKDIKELKTQKNKLAYNRYKGDGWTNSNAVKYINYNYLEGLWNRDTKASLAGKEPINDPVVNTRMFTISLRNAEILTDKEYREISGVGTTTTSETVNLILSNTLSIELPESVQSALLNRMGKMGDVMEIVLKNSILDERKLKPYSLKDYYDSLNDIDSGRVVPEDKNLFEAFEIKGPHEWAEEDNWIKLTDIDLSSGNFWKKSGALRLKLKGGFSLNPKFRVVVSNKKDYFKNCRGNNVYTVSNDGQNLEFTLNGKRVSEFVQLSVDERYYDGNSAEVISNFVRCRGDGKLNEIMRLEFLGFE
ncbi:hypothetical protein GOV14_02910 [Candidatus Pacearchaeota archaeon]|nr:hypothetical protein [Candidatus Pacearchaeota archaeon]